MDDQMTVSNLVIIQTIMESATSHPEYSSFPWPQHGNIPNPDRLQQTNLTPLQTTIIAIALTLVLLTSIFGNILVCLAVKTEDRLRKVGNYFLVSLAMADLLVSILVMSFAIVNDLLGHWIFNRNFCNIWISFDIMFSTASILNICAISVDRYMHIKLPFKYYTWMNTKTVVAMIALVWFLSAVISFIPINLGWHRIDAVGDKFHDDLTSTILPVTVTNHSQDIMLGLDTNKNKKFAPPLTQPQNDHTKLWNSELPDGHYDGFGSFATTSSPMRSDIFQCTMNLNARYAVVSSLVSFFIPCVIMLTIYALIFSAVRTRTRNARRGRLTMKTASGGKKTAPVSETAYHIANQQALSDRKAAITLGIIMGVFLACWLPFFIYNIILPIFPSCPYSAPLYQTLTWLGYLNSCLNPIIYSIFNHDFREAFKRILFRRMLCKSPRSKPIYKHSRSTINGRASRYDNLVYNGKKHYSGTNLVEFYSNSSSETIKEKVTPT